MSENLTDLSNGDTNTMYLMIALQILLIGERVFSKLMKRVKSCRCSECCTMDLSQSADRQPARVEHLNPEDESASSSYDIEKN